MTVHIFSQLRQSPPDKSVRCGCSRVRALARSVTFLSRRIAHVSLVLVQAATQLSVATSECNHIIWSIHFYRKPCLLCVLTTKTHCWSKSYFLSDGHFFLTKLRQNSKKTQKCLKIHKRGVCQCLSATPKHWLVTMG